MPLRLFQGHSRFETVQGRHNYLQFAAILLLLPAPSHGPICMKISVNVQNLMLNIIYIMLYPSKMQGEAKKGVKGAFLSAQRAIARAALAQSKI